MSSDKAGKYIQLFSV